MLFTNLLISCVVPLFITYFSYKIFRYYKLKKILGNIPTPEPEYFLIGNLLTLMKDSDLLFDRMRTMAANNYPIYRLSTFYVDIVNLLDPNDIEILLSSTKHLSKSKIYSFLNQWLGTGLLTSTGAKWHSRRKILTPAFHFNILQQFLVVFNEETKHLVQKFERECGKPSTNIVPYITHFTLQSIGETAMGLNNIDEDVQNNYRKAIHDIGQIFLKRLSKPWYRIEKIYNMSALGKREKKVVKVLHDFSNGIIERRIKENSVARTVPEIESYSTRKRLAMLDLLLSAKAAGADIDNEGIREEVDTFMFEGHDTTSMAISFILLSLANLKDIQEKVHDEIIQVVGPTKSPDYNDLQNLKYTERCIKEALRLFPSVPFISRYSGEEFKTSSGHVIPAGTVCHVHIFDIHRNYRIYPDPLKFDPDRFLPEACNERHPFAYIPFSAGPRNCIGQRFALLELKTVLCGILRNFVLEPIDKIFDIKFRPDLVLRPKGDIRIKIVPRVRQ